MRRQEGGGRTFSAPEWWTSFVGWARLRQSASGPCGCDARLRFTTSRQRWAPPHNPTPIRPLPTHHQDQTTTTTTTAITTATTPTTPYYYHAAVAATPTYSHSAITHSLTTTTLTTARIVGTTPKIRHGSLPVRLLRRRAPNHEPPTASLWQRHL
jgi:hypothetical protein